MWDRVALVVSLWASVTSVLRGILLWMILTKLECGGGGEERNEIIRDHKGDVIVVSLGTEGCGFDIEVEVRSPLEGLR